MPNSLRILRLKDTAVPVFLFSVPKLARLCIRVGPTAWAASEVLSLTLLAKLIGVLHAAVCRCKLVCVRLSVGGEFAVPF